jgi:hypothetical protein
MVICIKITHTLSFICRGISAAKIGIEGLNTNSYLPYNNTWIDRHVLTCVTVSIRENCRILYLHMVVIGHIS